MTPETSLPVNEKKRTSAGPSLDRCAADSYIHDRRDGYAHRADLDAVDDGGVPALANASELLDPGGTGYFVGDLGFA